MMGILINKFPETEGSRSNSLKKMCPLDYLINFFQVPDKEVTGYFWHDENGNSIENLYKDDPYPKLDKNGYYKGVKVVRVPHSFNTWKEASTDEDFEFILTREFEKHNYDGSINLFSNELKEEIEYEIIKYKENFISKERDRNLLEKANQFIEWLGEKTQKKESDLTIEGLFKLGFFEEANDLVKNNEGITIKDYIRSKEGDGIALIYNFYQKGWFKRKYKQQEILNAIETSGIKPVSRPTLNKNKDGNIGRKKTFDKETGKLTGIFDRYSYIHSVL